MIPRYTPEPFAELWSAANKFATWLEVELAACEAMEHPSAALVPAGTAAELRGLKLTLDPARIDE
ncbi:MAG: adenylosuccinate lyase, partial [Deltaproteobacteria bacterium]|nr:adenylosuccinate lyase [Deltaproteobacteria bacterium]MBW2535675.1 adenylosuccinate lyase [Deltaproteobacteria bacterium]